MYTSNVFSAILLISVRGTIERYKKACSDAVNPPSVTEANTQVPIYIV